MKNISTLISPDILDNLKKSTPPKAFGDQLTNIAQQQVINGVVNSPLTQLYKEKANFIQENISLDINHQITLQKLTLDNTPTTIIVNGQSVIQPPAISNEEYEELKSIENKNYQLSIENLNIRKKKNKSDIDSIIKDPFQKHKDNIKKQTEKLNKVKSKTKEEKRKARKEKYKLVLKNNKKNITSILSLLFTNKIIEIVAQNSNIKKLIDDANIIIDDANASNLTEKLDNARIIRDNTLRVIQSNENKIISINQQVQNISTYINIFSTVVSIISSIPIPTSVPPGVGIPVKLIIKLVKISDKANRILLFLSALLPIIQSALDKIIQILKNYREQLHKINGVIDEFATPIDGIKYGNMFGEYKGFRFALKEENNPKFVVFLIY